MGPFLRGFVDELIKLGAGDALNSTADLSASKVTSSLNNTFKSPTLDVKKSGGTTPSAPRVPKPDPVTTPTMMTDYRGSA